MHVCFAQKFSNCSRRFQKHFQRDCRGWRKSSSPPRTTTNTATVIGKHRFRLCIGGLLCVVHMTIVAKSAPPKSTELHYPLGQTERDRVSQSKKEPSGRRRLPSTTLYNKTGEELSRAPQDDWRDDAESFKQGVGPGEKQKKNENKKERIVLLFSVFSHPHHIPSITLPWWINRLTYPVSTHPYNLPLFVPTNLRLCARNA